MSVWNHLKRILSILNYNKLNVLHTNKESHLSTDITQECTKLVGFFLLYFLVVERFEEDIQLKIQGRNQFPGYLSLFGLFSLLRVSTTSTRGNQRILVRLGRAWLYLCKIFSDVVLRLCVFRRQIFDYNNC